MQQPLSLKWDLDSLYPGGSASQELQRQLQTLDRDITELTDKVKDGSDVSLSDLIASLQDVEKRLYDALNFITCLTAQNVKDERAKILQGNVVQLVAAYESLMARFDQRLVELPDEEWRQLLQQPEIQPLQYNLEERRRRSEEKLPPEQEVLINNLSVDGYHAWDELYHTVVGRIVIPFEEDGKTTELSAGQAYNKLHSEDRGVRERMAAKWEEAWANEAELCATALNHLAGYRLNVYHHRGWHDVLKEPLEINRMAPETLAVMWKVIERNKDIFVRFLQRKAQLLGVDALTWEDVEAPLGTVSKKMTYDEAAAFIVKHFRRFSPKMADFAEMAFEGRWIEAEDRPGKRTGGFCAPLPAKKESRIFLTYEGSMDNVSTVAHELGHAYHQHVMNDMPQFTQNYAMNVAETASTFAELIVSDAAVDEADSDEERIVLLEDKIKRAIAFFMNIHARFLFETRFYEKRRQGVVSVEELNQLMVDAQKEAYKDSLATYHPHFWAAKLHFYATDVPFYNFPYTFGFLFSSGVYQEAKKYSKGFEDKYVALLRDTGRMRTETLAERHLGVDLTKPEFWQQAVDASVADVEQFLALTEK